VSAKIYYAGVRLWGKNQENAFFTINAIVANHAPVNASDSISTTATAINTTSENTTTINTTHTNTAGPDDTQRDIRSKEKVAIMAWLGELTHAELLMEMPETHLEYLSKSLDDWTEVIERE
jgi:hypothetical protein